MVEDPQEVAERAVQAEQAFQAELTSAGGLAESTLAPDKAGDSQQH